MLAYRSAMTVAVLSVQPLHNVLINRAEHSYSCGESFPRTTRQLVLLLPMSNNVGPTL